MSIEIRKLAAMLICKLAKNDREAQEFLCECFEFTPFQGKVSVNQMPANVEDELSKNPQLLITLRKAHDSSKWYWCYPQVDLKANNDNSASNELIKDFPDPAEHWIGFYLTELKEKSTRNHTTPEQSDCAQTLNKKKAVNKTAQNAKEVPQLAINKLPVSAVRPRDLSNMMNAVVEKNIEETKDSKTKDKFLINSIDDTPMDDIEPEYPVVGNAFKYRFSTSNKPIPSLIKSKISKPTGGKVAQELSIRDPKTKTSLGKTNYNPIKYATKTREVDKLQTAAHIQQKAKPQTKIQTSKKYAQCFKPNTTRDSYKKPQIKTTMDTKMKKPSIKSINKKYKKDAPKPAIYMRNRSG